MRLRTWLKIFTLHVMARLGCSRPGQGIIFPDQLAKILEQYGCTDIRNCHAVKPNINACSTLTIDVRSLTKRGCDPMKGQYLWTPTQQCHTILQQGPCGHGQRLVLNYDDELICRDAPCTQCQLRSLSTIKCPESFIAITNEYGEDECDCTTGELFHPQTNKCYSSYSQGPCASGYIIKVLDKGNQGYGSCVVNSCPKPGMVRMGPDCHEDTTASATTGCYLINDTGPCEEGNALDVRNILANPECFTINSYSLVTTNCARGSRRDFARRCRRARGKSTLRGPMRLHSPSGNATAPGNYSTGSCPENLFFFQGRCFPISTPTTQ